MMEVRTVCGPLCLLSCSLSKKCPHRLGSNVCLLSHPNIHCCFLLLFFPEMKTSVIPKHFLVLQSDMKLLCNEQSEQTHPILLRITIYRIEKCGWEQRDNSRFSPHCCLVVIPILAGQFGSVRLRFLPFNWKKQEFNNSA